MDTKVISFTHRKENHSNKEKYQNIITDLKTLIRIALAKYYQFQLDIDLEKEAAIKNEVFSYLDIILTKEVLSQSQTEAFFQTIHSLMEGKVTSEIETIEQIANVMIYIWLVKNTNAKMLDCSLEVLYCILEALAESNQPLILLKPHLNVYFNEEVFLELKKHLENDGSNIIFQLTNLYEEKFLNYNQEQNKSLFLNKLKNITSSTSSMIPKIQLMTISNVYDILKRYSEEVRNTFGIEMQLVLCPEQQLAKLHKFCYLPLARQQQFLKEMNMINHYSDFSLLNRISLMMNLIVCYEREIDFQTTIITPEFGRKRSNKK